MRDDMHRVLVTRARLGGKVRREGRARRVVEMPAFVGMKRSHALAKGDLKMLNEYLQPLRRYLHAQVGRPWDKVWSEVSAGLRASSAVQQHVRDHVFDFVAKDVSLRGREVWVHEYGRERPLRESMRELWIDPRTGILRSNRRRVTLRQARRARREQTERELCTRMVPGKGDVQYHHLRDGAWWEVTLAHEPNPPSPDATADGRGAGRRARGAPHERTLRKGRRVCGRQASAIAARGRAFAPGCRCPPDQAPRVDSTRLECREDAK